MHQLRAMFLGLAAPQAGRDDPRRTSMRLLAVVSFCLVYLIGLFFTENASAFDYNEHKYISNVGFRIAVAASLSSCVRQDDLLRLVSEDAIAHSYSFGDMVGLADYVHDVETLLEQQGESNTIQGYDRESDWKHIAANMNDRLRFLQAAHDNESHFQLAALMAHLNHHDTAILMARDGRIFRAMVLEAYGLHFLEDFHAPGHVATVRGVLPDYVSIAVHEKFNAVGMDFKIYGGDGEMARLAAVAAGLNLQSLAHDVPEELLLGADDFEKLREALTSGSSQRFRGDSMLGRNKVQAAYLAVLAARSVLDVLNAACTDGGTYRSTGKNSFVPVCWYFGFYPPNNLACAGKPVPGSRGALKRASTPFGEYETSRPSFLYFVFKPGDVFLLSYYNEFSLARGIEGHAGSSEMVAENLLVSLLPSRSLNGEDVPRKVQKAQQFGWLAPSLLYGVSHTVGDTNSSGFHTRLLLAVPRIDVQVSLSYGVRYYDIGRGQTITTYPLGYGLEAGFGFLLLHLGINEELSKVPKTGELRSRRLVRGGVTVVLAKSVYMEPFRKIGKMLKRRPDRGSAQSNLGNGPAGTQACPPPPATISGTDERQSRLDSTERIGSHAIRERAHHQGWSHGRAEGSGHRGDHGDPATRAQQAAGPDAYRDR